MPRFRIHLSNKEIVHLSAPTPDAVRKWVLKALESSYQPDIRPVITKVKLDRSAT